MNKKALIASIVVTFGVIGGALLVRPSKKPDQPQTKAAQSETKSEEKTFTTQQLAEADGKDGHKCYVAVDGKVYEIEQGRLWQNGEHTTSNGQAHCGKDLSEAIKQSPHGKSKLEALKVVGKLQN